MSTQQTYTLPIRSPEYVEVIEDIRLHLGMTQYETTARMGVDRATWSRVINKRSRSRTATPGTKARPTFDTIAAMADAVGMRLVLVPAGTREVRPTVLPERPEGVTLREQASPFMRRIGALVRRYRTALGLTVHQAARRACATDESWSALESGHASSRFHGADRLREILSTVGASLEPVEPHHLPLLQLTPEDVEQVRALVRWYRDRAPKHMAARFASIADKLGVDSADKAA